MHRPVLFLFVLVLVLLTQSPAQNKLFESEEVITLKIEAPFSKLIADRSENEPDFPAIVSYKEGKTKIKIDAEIEIRGNYRRRADICPFPPLKLKVKKENRAGTIFEAQKKLKIVTHCQGEEYVLREYMVYKFYQMLTPFSFKVRLVKIQYRDTEKQMVPVNAYAFFIESEKTLEKRLAGKSIDEKTKVLSSEVNPDQLILLHMFQFMIGNLDWGITERKNMSILQLTEGQEIYPIPYDFDFAACVQAPYTGLEKGFDRRYFRKICRTRAEFETLFNFIRSKRTDLENLFMNFSLLPKSGRQEAMQYLNEFFGIIEDEQKVKEIFLDACPDTKLNSDNKSNQE